MKLHPHFNFRLHDAIALILGYREATTINGPDWAKPEYGVDVNHGDRSLYVYCDLVEDQIVGDSTVKVIRTVPLTHKPGVVTPLVRHFHTDNPRYVPVSQRNTQTVEIHTRDDTGHDVPFIAGKVIVKLHFRLKRPHSCTVSSWTSKRWRHAGFSRSSHTERHAIGRCARWFSKKHYTLFYLLQRRLARICCEPEQGQPLEF